MKSKKRKLRVNDIKHINDRELAKAIVQLIRETPVPAKIVLEVR